MYIGLCDDVHLIGDDIITIEMKAHVLLSASKGINLATNME
jgi:hypothetical protein